jgi:ABC-type antimicrobial peptide transport system permease subunit
VLGVRRPRVTQAPPAPATNPLTALLAATVVLVATFVATVGPIGRVAKLAPAQVLRQ